MAKGHWSFLHEWVIYEYLRSRADEKTLRLKQYYLNGRLLGKPKWKRVIYLLPIEGTAFPDIRGIKLSGEINYRPAEVKFTTSLFNYHNAANHTENFDQFVNHRGFILVASHDYLPGNGLLEKYPQIDVYAIEIEDFITFCRENFSRLLNKQIKAHGVSRIWLMYQGGNFNSGIENIHAARQSLIWCPTENLTGIDLAPNDRILFYKTGGIGQAQL